MNYITSDDKLYQSLRTNYSDSTFIKRLTYVINRDKVRDLTYTLYLWGYGIIEDIKELEEIYKEITGKYYK